jgi:uncharacterized membrane protein
VHFPIALLLAAVLLDFVAVFTRREALAACAGVVLVLAALGAVGAVTTGLIADDVVEQAVDGSPAEKVVDLHETAALITTGLVLVLAVWRLALKFAQPAGGRRWLYLGVLLAAAIMVAATGALGGRLTYDYGVGVRATLGAPAAAPAR